MKSLCVIPARYASTRLPGKPLLDLAGKSLLRTVYDRVEGFELFDRVIVATDDDRIVDHCEENDLEVKLTRTDHVSGTDRVAEVIEEMRDYDIIVNVQGDEPFIERELLSQMILALRSEDGSIVTGVAPLQLDIGNPNLVKVVMDDQLRALYFSRSPIPYCRVRSDGFTYYRHVGTYGFRRSTLLGLVQLPVSLLEQTESLEQLRWLQSGQKIHCIVGPWEGRGVDTPEDLEAARRALTSSS